jgi:hypothetical protein
MAEAMSDAERIVAEALTRYDAEVDPLGAANTAAERRAQAQAVLRALAENLTPAMIEAAGRAIYDRTRDSKQTPWERLRAEHQEPWIEDARAALPGMLRAETRLPHETDAADWPELAGDLLRKRAETREEQS